MRTAILYFCVVLAPVMRAADNQSQSPSLTIYNQNFAVVRQGVPLDLSSGVNHVVFSDITAHLEPDSVVLRDPRGNKLNILEQNYRNDPVSEGLLLSLFEGKTLGFELPDHTIVKGKVIRSGYVPQYEIPGPYGNQRQVTGNGSSQPIIEVDGQLQFRLPGQPVFPALGDDTILKPTLDWQLQSGANGHTVAELSYVTSGMSWHADYNITAPESGDVADIVGWVTLDNQSGKRFENARIKLMAGDVAKLQEVNTRDFAFASAKAEVSLGGPQVTEKAFDEYHLYTLERPTSLLDHEIKQVEFLRAASVHATRIYVYDGLKLPSQYRGWPAESIRDNANFGTESNPKVWAMLEFKNVKENNLGMPLPAGRVRLYRREQDGQMEFIGEDRIDHTPANETVRLYTGNAFDVVGERRRTNFKANNSDHWADESFEITLRNHKATPVEVRVVEHLYRWNNWSITQKSDEFTKTDAQTIEFRVRLAPDAVKKLNYTTHYSW
jgi:hypothetical protein